MRLTAPQRLIYDAEKYIGGSVSVMCGIMTVERPCPEERVTEAIREIYRTNDALNLRLDETGAEPLFVPTDPDEREIPVIRVNDERELEAIGSEAARTPFDLAGPLSDLRAVVFPGGYGIVLRLHHLLGDAWSMSLIGTQLNNIIEGRPSQRFSFTEYAATEAAYFESRRCERDRAYFMRAYDGIGAPTFLSDRDSDDYDAKCLRLTMPGDVRRKLTAFAEREELSENALLFGVFALYFAKKRGCPEAFYLGIPVLGRVSEQELNTVGMFVNTAPVSIRPDYGASLIENLKSVADEILSVFRHQKYNYGLLLRDLRETRGYTGRLYDTIVNYQSDDIFVDAEMRATEYVRGRYVETLQLAFSSRGGEEGLTVDYIYKPSKLTEAEVGRIHEELSNLVDTVLEAPELPLKELCLVPDLPRFLETVCTGPAAPVPDGSLYELFREQAEKTPETTAVLCGDVELTYKELLARADDAAARLAGLGVREGDVVAVRLERTELIVALQLAVMKRGGVFLPADKRFPPKRLAYLCRDCGVRLLICDDASLPPPGTRAVTPAALFVAPALDLPAVRRENAYIIFTSGSTGTPKGCMLNRKGLVNFCVNNNTLPALRKRETNRFACVNSASFDYFIAETLLPLLNGYTVALLSEEESLRQDRFLEAAARYGVNVLMTTPTRLTLFFDGAADLSALRELDVICTSGEPLPEPLLEKMYAASPKAEIFNPLGPSECSVWDLGGNLDRAKGADVHLGGPIVNTRAYALDRFLKSVPVGAEGELCIAGAGVGGGYPGHPELTAERFVDDPYGEGTLYRTGDVVIPREDGNFVYVGRNDTQIKLRGLRIEAAEVEAALSAVDGVELAAVKVQKDVGRQVLCAYYTGKEHSPADLRAALAVTLPRYMVPGIFTRLETMPLTVTGKIDRNALPETDLSKLVKDTEYIAPATDAEKLLTEAAAKELGAERIGLNDNFIDLGGDSLKVIGLIARLEKRGLTLTPRDVFTEPDFGALSRKLAPFEARAEALPEVGNEFPLSEAQRAVYTAQRLAPDVPLYNIPYILRVKSLDPERLQKAVDGLVSRCEILRVRFEDRPDGPVQIVQDNVTCPVTEIDGEIADFIRPFDLTKAPPLRVGYKGNVLVFDIHHLVADGASIPLYIAALNDLYMGREPENEPVPFKYFAFRDAVTAAGTADQNVRWDEAPALNLPYDGPRTEPRAYRGKTIYRPLDSAAKTNLSAMSGKEGVTPFVCALAAYSVTLARFSGARDLTVGVPRSGRNTKNRNVRGMFVRTLPVRLKPEGELSVREYLKAVRETTATDGPSEKSPSAAPRVSFTWQQDAMTAPTFADAPAEVLPAPLGVSKFDLDLTVYPNGDGAVCALTYDTDLFAERTAVRLFDGFERVLETMRGDVRLKEISVLSPGQTDTLRAFSEGPKTELPETSVAGLFREQAAKTPDNRAVIAGDRTLTYRELDVLSDRVAAGLQEKGIKPGDRVAFLLPRKSFLFTVILGILKAGAAYVPVDDELPESRKNYYLHDSGTRLCLTEETAKTLEKTAAPIRPVNVSGTAGAYVIYTSGSTGEPKGVRILHRNLTNYVTSLKEIYGERVSMPVFTSIGVDLTVTSLFLPLVTGGAAHVYDGQFGETLGAIRKNENITIIKGTPTHLRLLTENGARFPAGVKALILGGEALTDADARQFTAALAEGGEIHNEYGPTETAVGCMDFVFGRADNEKTVPIGRPIRNTRVYVLDRDLLPAPVGVTGQICIAGAGVADGYLDRPELTEEKFVDDPFGEGKMYLTGDLGYWREDGQLVFVGRNDFQIKLHGQRIEPGEIEAALNAVPGVTNAVVMAQTDGERQALCAYYTGEEKAPEDLRAVLAVTLPRYMIPQAFVHLDNMPLTMSGKIDRNALQKADLTQFHSETEYIPPETEEERVLAEVFADVLGVEKAGRNDNFFTLGGDSIRAIYVASKLQSRGWDLSVPDLMRAADLGSLAGKLRTLGAQTTRPADTGTVRLSLPPAARAYLVRRSEMPADFSQSCIIKTASDADTLKKSLAALARCHPILRAALDGDALVIPPEYMAPPVRFSVETVSAEEGGEAEARRRLQTRKVRFDLATGPLLDAALCTVGNEGLLRLTIHHLAVDLFSWEILLGDLTRLISTGGDGTALPESAASYAGWAKALEAYAAGMSAEESAYWERTAWKAERPPALVAPEDPEMPGETKTMTVSKELADKLLKLERDEDVRLDVSLLAALGNAAGQIAGGDALICVESLGRPVLPAGTPVDGVVGWLTAIYPLNVEPLDDVTRLLFDVRRELKSVPQSGIGWLLRYGRLPDNANLMFNFYRSRAAERLNVESVEPTGDISLDALFPGFVSADCAYVDGKLTVRLSCPPMRRRETLIEDLSRAFMHTLTAIAGTADFSLRRADAADDFSDDRLTYDELTELESIFDESDET